jgi:hypothetical protein
MDWALTGPGLKACGPFIQMVRPTVKKTSTAIRIEIGERKGVLRPMNMPPAMNR